MIIGISDEGVIEGIDDQVNKKYQSSIEESLNMYVSEIVKRLRETLRFHCSSISAIKVGEKHVVHVYVERTVDANYILNDKTAYIRKGATSQKMLCLEKRDSNNHLLSSMRI